LPGCATLANLVEFGKTGVCPAANRKDNGLSTASSSSIPLNVFQRLVRGWDRVHPYNAAQALKIAGVIDARKAERAWADALEATHLGRVHVNGRRFRHELLNGELVKYPIQVLPAGTLISEYLSAELNRPFDDPHEPPFRPFVLLGEGWFYFGVVYQHWVADSVAIRMLLREWFVRVFEPSLARCEPLPHPADGYWNLFGPRRAGWRTADTALAVLRRHLRYRRARKVKTFGKDDYPVHVLLREAPGGLIDRLHAFARSHRLKLNDVFLAAVAEVCHQFVPTQSRRNRRDLAVGSIVDLRPHAGTDLSDTFGLFLGFTEVVCRPPELRNFNKLLRSIGNQNRLHRQDGIPQSSLGWLLAALAAKRFVPPDELYHFYRKETPLVGGVSNVNLNRSWATQFHPSPILEYVRVSPTGPMVPLVFTLTTLGQRLHLSLTYRPVLLNDAAASRMADAFLQRLKSLVESGA
jgi:hypothetical protein